MLPNHFFPAKAVRAVKDAVRTVRAIRSGRPAVRTVKDAVLSGLAVQIVHAARAYPVARGDLGFRVVRGDPHFMSLLHIGDFIHRLTNAC